MADTPGRAGGRASAGQPGRGAERGRGERRMTAFDAAEIERRRTELCRECTAPDGRLVLPHRALLATGSV
ncbi:hypothetical protein ACH4TU_08965 [Streptomyces physcomitrii]|uniref:hypothetical protein n=1 Tax=Streptomyces physcomitrii TaxID=2724184 RepID=UPI000864BE3E|nr:hypothetical protein SLNHY_2113 [Streptomyces albus]